MLLQQELFLSITNGSNPLSALSQSSFFSGVFTGGYLALALAVLCVFLLAVIILQGRQTNKAIRLVRDRVDNLSRPWVKIKTVDNNPKAAGFYREYAVVFANYGDAPAMNVSVDVAGNTAPPDIYKKVRSDGHSTLMPRQEIVKNIQINNRVFNDVEAGREDFYVLASATYQGVDDKKVYLSRTLLKYNCDSDTFDITQELIM